MSPAEKRNPAGGPGSSSTLVAGLPKNPSEVAARLQRRLSAFALAMDSTIRDLETLQRYVQALSAGFGLTPEERHELDRIALRLFDAREVLG